MWFSFQFHSFLFQSTGKTGAGGCARSGTPLKKDDFTSSKEQAPFQRGAPLFLLDGEQLRPQELNWSMMFQSAGQQPVPAPLSPAEPRFH